MRNKEQVSAQGLRPDKERGTRNEEQGTRNEERGTKNQELKNHKVIP